MSNLFIDMQQKQLHARAAPSFSSLHSNDQQQDEANISAEEDELTNLLSLKLKKPKHWKWELSTSRSCSNIALPRILLYDHAGELLVDVNSQEEQVYKQPSEYEQPYSSTSPTTFIQSAPSTKTRESRKRSSKAATTNLMHSIKQVLGDEFNDLQIQEVTPSPQRSGSHSRRLSSSSPFNSNTSTVDFFTNELPDYKVERRSSSLRSVRFKMAEASPTTNSPLNPSYSPLTNLPTPPSTSTTITATSSSASGPREKRRYRRSNSSGRSSLNSESILERFSFQKGRFSSPEHAEEHEVYHPPCYFLRTSKAGTLVVQQDSFNRYKRRRKPRHSSSENIRYECSPKNRSTSSLKFPDTTNNQQHLEVPETHDLQTGSLQDVNEMQQKRSRKKKYAVRRYRSDANISLHKELLSTSEEEEEERRWQEVGGKRQQPKYPSIRRRSKRDVMRMLPDSTILHSLEESPTAR